MNQWTKWILASAVVAITLTAVSPQSAEASWRRYWGGYGGNTGRTWAAIYPRTLFVNPPGVNAFGRPPFYLQATPPYGTFFYRGSFPGAYPYAGYYSPHAGYDAPYAGYYWRPY